MRTPVEAGGDDGGGVANSSPGLGSVITESPAAPGALWPQLSSSLVNASCCVLIDDVARFDPCASPAERPGGPPSTPCSRRRIRPKLAAAPGAASPAPASSLRDAVASGPSALMPSVEALFPPAAARAAAAAAGAGPGGFSHARPSPGYDRSSPRPHTPAAQLVKGAPFVKQGFSLLPPPPLLVLALLAVARLGGATAAPASSRETEDAAAVDPVEAFVRAFVGVALAPFSPLFKLPCASPSLPLAPPGSESETATTCPAPPPSPVAGFAGPAPENIWPSLRLLRARSALPAAPSKLPLSAAPRGYLPASAPGPSAISSPFSSAPSSGTFGPAASSDAGLGVPFWLPRLARLSCAPGVSPGPTPTAVAGGVFSEAVGGQDRSVGRGLPSTPPCSPLAPSQASLPPPALPFLADNAAGVRPAPVAGAPTAVAGAEATAAGEKPCVCRGLTGDNSAEDSARSDHGLSLSAAQLLPWLLRLPLLPVPLDLSPLVAAAAAAAWPTPPRGGGDMKLVADAMLQLLGGTEEGSSK